MLTPMPRSYEFHILCTVNNPCNIIIIGSVDGLFAEQNICPISNTILFKRDIYTCRPTLQNRHISCSVWMIYCNNTQELTIHYNLTSNITDILQQFMELFVCNMLLFLILFSFMRGRTLINARNHLKIIMNMLLYIYRLYFWQKRHNYVE